MEIQITSINNTPVFVVPTTDRRWQRVYGATLDKGNNRWLFPAYEPFLSNVLHDFPKVHPNVTFSPEATTWYESYRSISDYRKDIANYTFPTKSYEHQLDGVAELLSNYRWGLRWGMGTGKTKVVVDTALILKCKVLVLCPLVAVDTWIRETEIHSGGQLQVVGFTAKSRQKKLDLLTELSHSDIIVTTYDTAKIYGTPRIFPETLKLFSGIGTKTLTTPMRRLFSQLNDPDMQAQLTRDWLQDKKKPQQLRDEIANEIQGRVQWITHIPYTLIVADESHRIANRQSIRTQVCLELSKRACRRVLLSGTMVGGDPGHLYPQLKFLAPYLMPEDWMHFKEKFFISSSYDKHIIIGYRKIHILNNRVSRVTSERHLDDCVDLPERRIETLTFELTRAQKRDYNYIVKTSALILPDATELTMANGAVRNGKLLQICGGFVYVPAAKDACDTCLFMRQCVADNVKPGSAQCGTRANVPKDERQVLRYPTNPKSNLLVERLTDLVPTSKAIIWAVYTEELDIIAAELRKNKWGFVRVDGTSTQYMRRWEDQFRNDENCRIYLSQITTGISVTLNSARHMFYFSRDFSTVVRHQSMDRNYRIGQDKKTVVYDLCAERSLELQQLYALDNKDEISALLTNKVECTLCSQYSHCRQNGISPWEKQCVLSTEKARVIMKARTV